MVTQIRHIFFLIELKYLKQLLCTMSNLFLLTSPMTPGAVPDPL